MNKLDEKINDLLKNIEKPEIKPTNIHHDTQENVLGDKKTSQPPIKNESVDEKGKTNHHERDLEEKILKVFENTEKETAPQQPEEKYNINEINLGDKFLEKNKYEPVLEEKNDLEKKILKANTEIEAKNTLPEDKEEEKAEEKNDLEKKILNALQKTEKEETPLISVAKPEPKPGAIVEAEPKPGAIVEAENILENKINNILKKTEKVIGPEPEHTITIIIKKPGTETEAEPEGDNVIITDKETDTSGTFIETKITKLNLEEDAADKKYKIKVS